MGNVAPGLPNRGKGYHGGTPTSIGRSVDLEGTEVQFQDDTVVTGSAPNLKRSGRTVVARLVRNSSGVALLPGRVVSWETGFHGTRVDGYVTTTAAAAAGVVDDRFAAAGVPDDELFWLIRQGPCLIKNNIAAAAGTVITEGAYVVALTAATSQATTAGRITNQTLTGATDVLAGQIQNRIGKAMSAKTTANTNVDVLIDLELQP